MQFNNNSSNLSLDESIDKLSKSVYLESPDIWIDLTDKINDKIFDEMVLFFASKYNALTVLKYAVENKFINLNLPSKNKTYKNIGQHLSSVSIQSKSSDVHNYLIKILVESNDNSTENTIVSKDIKVDNSSDIETNNATNESTSYEPVFLCPKCNSNIFNCGYKVCEDVTYRFDSDKNKLVEASRNSLDSIVCSNCNENIKNTSVKQLEGICTVQNCRNCSADLTSVGVIDKSKMIFNKESHKFDSTSTSFHCSNCDNLIDQSQKEYFNL